MKILFKTSILTILFISAFACNTSTDEIFEDIEDGSFTENLNVVSPPNPNVFPLLLAMNDYPDLNINLIPVAGGSGVPSKLASGEADITTIYSYIMAKHVITEAVPDLKLAAVTLWSNFYIVSAPEIQTMSDLIGKTLVISGPNGPGENGAPGQIIRAALARENMEPGTDLTILYLPLNEGMEMVSSGNADAILLAEPAATGYAIESFFAQNNLKVTINLQDVFDGFTEWESNQLPLGGVGVVGSFLENEEQKLHFDAFVNAYKASADKIMLGNQNDLNIISTGLNTYFGFDLPAPVIKRAILEGRLKFDSNTNINQIQNNLESFISEILGESPDEYFYE